MGAKTIVEPVEDGRRLLVRPLTTSLLRITLSLEAATLFFATLAFFGRRVFDPDWLALVYGGALIMVFVAGAGVQSRRWGVWFAALLQLVLIATGVLEPTMFLVGAGFSGLWVYCLVRGNRVDAANLRAHVLGEGERK